MRCRWASAGTRLQLVDPVALHVDRANEIAREQNLAQMTAMLGDARDLASRGMGTGYDAVLLLGPLYNDATRFRDPDRFGEGPSGSRGSRRSSTGSSTVCSTMRSFEGSSSAIFATASIATPICGRGPSSSRPPISITPTSSKPKHETPVVATCVSTPSKDPPESSTSPLISKVNSSRPAPLSPRGR